MAEPTFRGIVRAAIEGVWASIPDDQIEEFAGLLYRGLREAGIGLHPKGACVKVVPGPPPGRPMTPAEVQTLTAAAIDPSEFVFGDAPTDP